MAFLNGTSFIEGLFALVVIVIFFFFIAARMNKKSVMDFYNEFMDKIFGKTKDLNIENPLNKMKHNRSVPLK